MRLELANILKTLLIAFSIFPYPSSFIYCTETEAPAMKLKITIDNIISLKATMEDNKTSRDFMALLPMKLKLKDYSSTEKVSDLPDTLSTESSAPGYKASKGDITYYSPWGNLAIFYRDFGYASGLIKIGHLDSGIDILSKIKDGTEVLFELSDD
jgi:hypothetical protein